MTRLGIPALTGVGGWLARVALAGLVSLLSQAAIAGAPVAEMLAAGALPVLTFGAAAVGRQRLSGAAAQALCGGTSFCDIFSCRS